MVDSESKTINWNQLLHDHNNMDSMANDICKNGYMECTGLLPVTKFQLGKDWVVDISMDTTLEVTTARAGSRATRFAF